MGATFRQRLASDPYFAVRIKDVEREKLCPYSDQLLEEEDPDSMDFDSKIRMMNDQEFREHVRACQERQMTQQHNREKKTAREKRKILENL